MDKADATGRTGQRTPGVALPAAVAATAFGACSSDQAARAAVEQALEAGEVGS